MQTALILAVLALQTYCRQTQPSNELSIVPYRNKAPAKTSTIRKLSYIHIDGLQDSEMTSFFDIPYAAAARFEPATKPRSQLDRGVQRKRRPGHSCMIDTSSYLNYGTSTSEDCLNLNVYIPTPVNQDEPHEKLPVMVYVHGGSFKDGFGSAIIYSEGARKLMKLQRAILVSINYRLGVFGFYSPPGATASKRNLGIRDIRMSFEWVQEHIHMFGGDPDQVTAVGFSAGSSSSYFNLVSISLLLTAEDGTLSGLFSAAVLQSGFTLPILETPESIRAVSSYISQRSNCNIKDYQKLMKCMKELSPSDLLRLSIETNTAFDSPLGTIWLPVIDGEFIKRQQWQSLDMGLFVKVPLLMTMANSEAYTFMTKISTEKEASFWIKSALPYLGKSDINKIKSFYPEETASDPPFYKSSQIMTDYFFRCQCRALSIAYTRAKVPVTIAVFSHTPVLFRKTSTGSRIVAHGEDLAYIWQTHFAMSHENGEIHLSELFGSAILDFLACKSTTCKVGGKFDTQKWKSAHRDGDSKIYYMDLKAPINEIRAKSEPASDEKCNLFASQIRDRGDEISGLKIKNSYSVPEAPLFNFNPKNMVYLALNTVLGRKAHLQFDSISSIYDQTKGLISRNNPFQSSTKILELGTK